MWTSGYQSVPEDEKVSNGQLENSNIGTSLTYQSIDVETPSVIIDVSSGVVTTSKWRPQHSPLIIISLTLVFCVLFGSYGLYNTPHKLGGYVNKPLTAFEFKPWSEVTPEETGKFFLCPLPISFNTLYTNMYQMIRFEENTTRSLRETNARSGEYPQFCIHTLRRKRSTLTDQQLGKQYFFG